MIYPNLLAFEERRRYPGVRMSEEGKYPRLKYQWLHGLGTLKSKAGDRSCGRPNLLRICIIFLVFVCVCVWVYQNTFAMALLEGMLARIRGDRGRCWWIGRNTEQAAYKRTFGGGHKEEDM